MKQYNYFKTAECNDRFRIWLSQYPESFHDCDLERFTELVLELLDNDEDLESTHLTESVNSLDEDMVDVYMEKFFSMKTIYEKLKNRWNTK